MRIRQLVGNAVKVAVLGACAYIAINWQSIGGSADDREEFAGSECVDATRSRFEVTRAKVYSSASNANGFTVRLNVTLANGEQAKVVCLTTPQGGVRDVSIDVR